MAAEVEKGIKIIRDEFPAPYHAPTPKQTEFWRACQQPLQDEILFDGAIRSGKTQAACKMIASWAWEHGGPNWRFVIMRRTYRELEDSTKAAFLRGDGQMPPACPPGLILKEKKQDEMCILLNGAEILFRSAENPAETEDKLRNVTLAGFFIDQVEELDSDEYMHMYETLLSRCSDPRGPRKAILVANPGPEDHWVHRRFVDPKTSPPETARVHVTLEQNAWNLPESYVTKMRRTEQTNNMWFRRYIQGEWGAFGGKRFTAWDPSVHVINPLPIDPNWEIVQGIDYGWSHPTAAIWCAIDYSGRWYVVAEHYASQLPISQHARAMRETEEMLDIPPSSRWLDPSTWAKRSEYESPGLEFADYGIHAAKAQNDRLGGWNRIDEMLTMRMADGLPRLQVFSTCENLIREIPSLRCAVNAQGQIQDDVDKSRGGDDASDALRYAIMSRMPHPIMVEEEEEEDPRERRTKRLIEKARGRAEAILEV